MPAVRSAIPAVTVAASASLLVALLLTGGDAVAGGPLLVRSNGLPYLWPAGVAINYRTDNGPLSATVTEPSARARVAAMFSVWQNVATSSISYVRADSIASTGVFSDGDVSTIEEYDAVEASCINAGQSPVVYDADASILVALGMDEESVIGFAGPCAVNGTNVVSGQVVMNGLFQDGQAAPVPDIPAAAYDAAIIHEIGHFSGLDHSQVNVNCVTGSCGADDLAGLPTMFPFLLDSSQGQLAVDDVAWISRLYPQTSGATTFSNTHGTITGVVFFSDGESHAQFVNVIARQVNAGTGQDRTHAVAVVSGYKFSAIHGNPITEPQGSGFGSSAPGDIGLFEIPVPAGSYTVEVESIDTQFIDGSSIGSYQIAMPGSAPPRLGPIVVPAGVTVSGNNFTLIGTDPRFDQFEGP
jgi:hypothetical protein